MLRKTFWFGVCLVLFSTTTSTAWAAWFDTNFQYKQQITIQSSQVSGTQADFPVLITQADLDTAFFASGHVAKSTLSDMDIIFTDSTETTKLSREIVHYNSGSQEFEAWVKIPSLSGSSNTVIYMYYGYIGASELNSTDTWSNNFAAVWHMHDTPTGGAGDIVESTSNPNAGTSTSMNSSSVAGQMGNALSFDGANDYISVANHSSLQITGALTMSAWVHLPNDELNSYDTIITKKNAYNDGQGYYLELKPNDNDVNVSSSGNSWTNFDITDFTTNWHYVVGTIEGTTARGYRDGSAGTPATATLGALVSGTTGVTMGRQGGGTYAFIGDLDEVRLSSVARSAGWITTCSNNQGNPGAFYNVGSEISNYEDRYRSVGPGATTALATGSGNGLTIAGDTATFSSSLPAYVGVGDAVQYDSDGNSSIDSIVFIHARTTGTSYRVRTATGGIPLAVSGDQNWSVYRAYTSLTNVESGTENSGINNTVENFDAGNRDLVTNKEIMHIACYANGTTADTGNITWNGWSLSASYYLKIYTPYLSTEVGTSQRHNGVWTTSAYHIIEADDDGITLQDDFVRLEGLQIYTSQTNGNNEATIAIDALTSTGCDIRVSHCILRGSTEENDNNNGIHIFNTSSGTGTVYAWNNIIYDFSDSNNGHGIRLRDSGIAVYAYNNTIYNCAMGFRSGGDTFIVKNNIAETNDTGYRDGFTAGSDYNISSDNTAPGTNNKRNTTVAFENEAGDNFHLSNLDTVAKDWGADLSADAYLPLSYDSDRESRTVPWCAGADENDALALTATVTPTSTPSPTATPTLTVTESATATYSPTVTQTNTVTPTPTISATVTMTSTVSPTPTVTPPYTHTVTPTVTLTPTHSATSTTTPTYTVTRTATISPTSTNSPTITATSTVTTTATQTPEYIVPNDLDSVIIYPNPYRLDIKPQREISFDRMPAQAIIRLYSIDGQLVKTLRKDSNVPWLRWDLKNESGTYVASGVYVYHIVGNGQERFGKIAVVQ